MGIEQIQRPKQADTARFFSLIGVKWSQIVSRYKIETMKSTMGARRWVAVLTAIAMMFGAACFAGLWMNAIGKVSGWIGLPQYEGQIPKLQWYGTLWQSFTIALLFIAAFVLGLGKRVPPDEVRPAWSTLAFNYLVRLGLCIGGALAFVFLLRALPKLLR